MRNFRASQMAQYTPKGSNSKLNARWLWNNPKDNTKDREEALAQYITLLIGAIQISATALYVWIASFYNA